mmetsp:Transcript_16342/g.22774  ORF Transcript_16342/g.22774 Transcript_16342/m.22774 type:complete len:171 (+) Transcript_16342:141-653(+)
MTTSNNRTKGEEMAERAAKYEEAAFKAATLAKEFGEKDPFDNDSENPWHNVDNMFDQMRDAVKEVQKYRRPDPVEQDENETDETEDTFQEQYIEMMTEAFAEDIEEIREKSGEDVDVNILAECLSSGMEMFSKDEKDLFLEERLGGSEELSDGLTPHQRRRQEIGHNVEI